MIMFCQQLCGAIFVSIGQNVFSNELIKGLKPISGINPATVVKIGATEIKNVVDVRSFNEVLVAYNGALTKTFTAAVVMAALSIIGALCMEWKNIKKVQRGPPSKSSTGSDGHGPEEAEKGQVKEINSKGDDKIGDEKDLEVDHSEVNAGADAQPKCEGV